MFQSFTGNPTRARQVNLSGRPGTGAVKGPRRPVGVGSPQYTLVNAQQDRLSRQQERDRLIAVQTVQRIWRGRQSRQATRERQRQHWDSLEGNEGALSDESSPRTPTEFTSEAQCMINLALLLQTLDVAVDDDVRRLDWFIQRLLRTAQIDRFTLRAEKWKLPFARLARRSTSVLKTIRLPAATVPNQLSMLILLGSYFGDQITQFATDYYRALARITSDDVAQDSLRSNSETLLISAVQVLLYQTKIHRLHAYASFVTYYLSSPELPSRLESFDNLREGLDHGLLAAAVEHSLSKPTISSLSTKRRLWLLAYLIDFSTPSAPGATSTASTGTTGLRTIPLLLRSLVDEIRKRIDLSTSDEDMMAQPFSDSNGNSRRRSAEPLPSFVQRRLLSLVNKDSLTNLLSIIDSTTDSGSRSDSPGKLSGGSTAGGLADYANSLLQIFPRRSDDIRMWLYLSSTNVKAADGSRVRQPSLQYFWNASKRSKLFRDVRQGPESITRLLKATRQAEAGNSSLKEEQHQDWAMLLLFLELYSFVLKVIDEEEFFAHTSQNSPGLTHVASPSWTRQSSLSLDEVETLTIFLKNLAFALYWNVPSSADASSNYKANPYYGSVGGPKRPEMIDDGGTTSIERLSGLSVDRIKGIVTGILRMIYERDSRRRFLPNDFWLMTDKFDMTGFTAAVVAEEQSRHSVQQAEDEDEAGPEDDMDLDESVTTATAGTQHTHRVRAVEAMQRQQRTISRQKYLEAVTPRLEIMQNMPFFIRFATRVQIFREFVMLDQRRRRGQHVDPEAWRLSMLHDLALQHGPDGASRAQAIHSKHHAEIKRDSVFDDAYKQFYPLGDGIKEPIQITFIDKFDTVEAGIDGGGVTKEFLTSVTNEAFSAVNSLSLFAENDQHLLYPNPSAVDARKSLLRQAGVIEGSAEWNEQIRDLLRRYEFLGRVIGKCLYEGILVDVAFAGFFLLKWALTGGLGSAPKESNYRANLNDLKDLDEGLYQGLLQLKNYAGDVEDFSLNFTITDTIDDSVVGPSGHRPSNLATTTRELRPGGANIPVTNENRLVYISYVARHRLQVQPHLQTSAFLRGLGQVIEPSWLSMFNQTELQTLVGGASSEINVDDLRRHTIYTGLYSIGDDGQEHTTVQLFWGVMKSLTDEDRRKVLKFVTSTPRAPLLGFGQLNPMFSIRDAGNDQARLPSTSTCLNLLKLPRYEKEEELREKLLYAVNSGAGFDLS